MADKKIRLEENAVESSELFLSPDKFGELKKMVQTTWEESDAARTTWKGDKEEKLALYFGLIKPKSFPFENCANLHVPILRTIKDTVHSNLIGSFNFSKPVTVLPVGPEDANKAKETEKLLNWQLTNQVDYSDFIDKVLDSVLVYGHAPIKVRYVKETGDRPYDGIKLDVIPVERFLIPPDATDVDVDSWDYCAQEIPVTKSDLKKRLNALGKAREELNFDDLKSDGSKGILHGDSVLESIRDAVVGIDSAVKEVKRPGFFTLLEWYGSIDADEDGIDEPVKVLYLIENQSVLSVKSWKSPRPHAVIRFSPVLNRAYGESIPDLLHRINEETNSLHNLKVDSITFKNIPFGFYDPMSGMNPESIKLTPGLLIPVNGSPSNAVYFPALNTSLPDFFREEEFLMTLAERLMGAGANIQGAINPKRISATEVASIDRRSGIRFLTIFLRIMRGLKQVFNLMLHYDKKLMPSELKIRVGGIDSSPIAFDSVEKENISGNFDIIVNGTSIVDEQADKSDQLMVYNIALSNPLIARDENALYEVTKDTFEKLGVKRQYAYLQRPSSQIPKNPDEEHALFAQEQDIMPNLAENVEQHLGAHSALINSDKFGFLPKKGQILLMKHYSETLRMKEAIEKQALIQRLMQVNQALMVHQATGALPMDNQGGQESNGQPKASVQ